VYTTREFAEYAGKNLVLVQVDFPRNKKQSAALKKANQALQEKFKVDGFPTLGLLDSEGKKLGEKVGYDPGSGPKAVIGDLEKLRKN
jgi:thioredoxin-related protein